jgi:hypothetical protein
LKSNCQLILKLKVCLLILKSIQSLRYKTQFSKKDANSVSYKRALWIKKGFYTNKEYDEYRLFMEQISRNERQNNFNPTTL